MKALPASSRIVILFGALLAASIVSADIAPYPNGPGFPGKWFGHGDNPRPAPLPAKVNPPDATLAKTLSEASMSRLQEALIQMAPAAGAAVRSYMQALYKDRVEKQQSGQITPQEARQLAELQQMVDEGSLSIPDASSGTTP